MRIVVINHVTLDGVMQSPGRPDEDIRGGFKYGGWAASRNHEIMIRAVGERMSTPNGGMLLGRRSYDDMLSAWNSKGGPFKDGLNNARKFVVSRDPTTDPKWPNSTLVHGDVVKEITALKQKPGGNLVVMGSGELIRSLLLPDGLVDEFVLMIHPLLLGNGRRLFEDSKTTSELKLNHCEATPTGVIIAAYQPS